MVILASRLAGQGPVGGQPEDPRLKKIFADWQRRQVHPKGGRYRVAGERVLPKGSFRDDHGRPYNPVQPPRDVHLKKDWLLLIDFERQRLRLEAEDHAYVRVSGQVIPEFSVRAFDGTTVRTFRPKERNGSLNLSNSTDPEFYEATGNLKMATFDAAYWPLFAAHGLLTPVGVEITISNLRWQPDPEMFYIHGEGVHEGRRCLIVRTQTLKRLTAVNDEFWVDPARDSAVVRQLWLSDGKPVHDWDIRYQKTPHGWLPSDWTFTLRMFGVTIGVEKMRVIELATEPYFTDADFSIELPAGSLVGKVKYGDPVSPKQPQLLQEERKLYRVSEGGGLQEMVLEGGTLRPAWRSRLKWFLALPVIALVAWLAVRRWRRLRTA
jgi:hypothetical protein